MQIVNTLTCDRQKVLTSKDDRISNASDDKVLMDGRDLFVLPGLCDLHFYSANGCDFGCR
mgnify:CR=1 FL=1